MTKTGKVFLLAAVFLLVSITAHAQDGPSGSDEWRYQITPYLWLPGIDADATVAGSTVPLDLSIGDILDNFDIFGLSARVEAWKGKWGLIFDGMYVDVGGEFSLQTPGPLDVGVDVDIVQTTLDFGVGYRLVEGPAFRFEPYVGLRYAHLKEEITLSVAAGPLGEKGQLLGGTADWLEPFVGGRIVFLLTEKLDFAVRGEVGGFGLGSASELTWSIIAGLDYQPWQRTSLKLAYRLYDIDYEHGSGVEQFGLDGQMGGLWLGVTLYR